jgi:hypothetical protein
VVPAEPFIDVKKERGGRGAARLDRLITDQGRPWRAGPVIAYRLVTSDGSHASCASAVGPRLGAAASRRCLRSGPAARCTVVGAEGPAEQLGASRAGATHRPEPRIGQPGRGGAGQAETAGRRLRRRVRVRLVTDPRFPESSPPAG